MTIQDSLFLLLVSFWLHNKHRQIGKLWFPSGLSFPFVKISELLCQYYIKQS